MLGCYPRSQSHYLRLICVAVRSWSEACVAFALFVTSCTPYNNTVSASNAPIRANAPPVKKPVVFVRERFKVRRPTRALVMGVSTFDSELAAVGDTAIVASETGILLVPQKGRPSLQSHLSAPVAVAGNILVGSANNGAVGLEVPSRRVLWRANVCRFKPSFMLQWRDNVIVGCPSADHLVRTTYLLASKSGNVLRKNNIHWSGFSPIDSGVDPGRFAILSGLGNGGFRDSIAVFDKSSGALLWTANDLWVFGRYDDLFYAYEVPTAITGWSREVRFLTISDRGINRV